MSNTRNKRLDWIESQLTPQAWALKQGKHFQRYPTRTITMCPDGRFTDGATTISAEDIRENDVLLVVQYEKAVSFQTAKNPPAVLATLQDEAIAEDLVRFPKPSQAPEKTE